MNKYYYLLNGKVMKGGEMPNITNPNNDSLIYGDTYIRRWLSSLQPCEISENEFYKIHDYLIENIPFKNSDISNPIDITDIVKEKDGKIYFKQPTEKQVESECEAVEFAEWIQSEKWVYNKGLYYKGLSEQIIVTTKQLYEIFKNR